MNRLRLVLASAVFNACLSVTTGLGTLNQFRLPATHKLSGKRECSVSLFRNFSKTPAHLLQILQYVACSLCHHPELLALVSTI
jgi:hypothetical protein